MDFPDDWGCEYAEAARLERHALTALPDPQTGRVEDTCWNSEPEDEEFNELEQ